MFHGRISLNSVLLLLLVNCEWVQVGIDVYIPHRKNQVKAYSSPWFSPAYAAAIVHRNHFLEDIFKFGASAAASEFCEWVQIGIDVYIPHRKYQVKLHSSPWFSAACAVVIVHFFRLHQKEKSSDSQVKFRQASNRWKRVLKLPNFHMLIKQKSLLLPRNLTLVTFAELLIVFSTKVNLLYLLY